MRPILIDLFGYRVSSFGVMMAIGFLAATWITERQMRERGLDANLSYPMLLWCMVGGILGSKLYYAIDISLQTHESFWQLLTASRGITWYGGVIGLLAASAVGCRWHGLPILPYWDTICVGACVGQAFGRLGCFLNGDDYGRTTHVAWGVSFPEGSPAIFEAVHPTQLYEMGWLLVAAWILWMRRHRSPWLGAEYLVLTGIGRFAIEILRVNPRVAFGLTEPQIIALLAVAAFGSVCHVLARGEKETK